MTIKKTTQSLNVDDTTPNPPVEETTTTTTTTSVISEPVQQQQQDSGNEEPPKAFCVKCKAKHVMENPVPLILKNGKAALKGICQNCKKTTYKLTKKNKD